VLLRAASAGEQDVLQRHREDDWQEVLLLAARSPAVVPFLGIHPWFADTAGTGWENRLKHFLALLLCGIGEAGLDRKCPADMQRQLESSRTSCNWPLSSGGRLRSTVWAAGAASWTSLNSRKTGSAADHYDPCLQRSLEMMHRLVRLAAGFPFRQLSAIRPRALQRVAQETPVDRLLLETDAPTVCRQC